MYVYIQVCTYTTTYVFFVLLKLLILLILFDTVNIENVVNSVTIIMIVMFTPTCEAISSIEPPTRPRQQHRASAPPEAAALRHYSQAPRHNAAAERSCRAAAPCGAGTRGDGRFLRGISTRKTMQKKWMNTKKTEI